MSFERDLVRELISEIDAAVGGMTTEQIHARLDALADLGLKVSICYGESGERGRLYSVDVMTPDLRSFAHPFAAKSLEQALWIAEIEGPKIA